MVEKEKSPPIDVSELEEKAGKEKGKGKNPGEKGKLSYTGNKPISEEGKEEGVERLVGFGRFSFKLRMDPKIVRLILPIVVSVALAAVMLTMFAPNRTQFDILAGQVSALGGTSSDSIQTLAGRLDYEVARIDNVINAMGGYVKKDELSGYVSKGELEVEIDGLGGVDALGEEVGLLGGLLQSLMEEYLSLKSVVEGLD